MSVRPKKVALVIETSRAYGRGLMSGIWQYIREHQRWSILFRPHGLGQTSLNWIADWAGDGIIAMVSNQQCARLLRLSSIPCLDVLGELTSCGFPYIGPDNKTIATLAADHLMDRGFRDFAVCGFRKGSRPQLDARSEAFEAIIENAGFSCHAYHSRGGGRNGPSWGVDHEQIVRWIRKLPKPVGIFTCNDIRGREVLEACQAAGIAVPEQIAVLSTGNDELLCQLNDKQLTSIDVESHRIGFRAAGLLEQMMDGKAVKELTYVPPQRVVTRQSTDILAVEDPEIALALEFIRRHACDRIDVGEVVAHVHLERRVLERRFRAILGRSPKAEIIRVQLAQAKELLIETSLTSTEIASRCGFSSPAYFMDLFHRKVGVTPKTYRQINP